MLESLFFVLFGFAVFLCVLTVFDKEEIAWPVLSFIMWIVLAICVNTIEMPYAFITSTDNVVTGLTKYSGGSYLTWLFLGVAIVFTFMLFSRVWEMQRKEEKAMGETHG